MNNPNDDLDDQLYILLASMKEYREAIADDKKRLETFYNEVGSEVLNKAEESLEKANKKHTGALNNSIQHLNQVTAKLNAKFTLFFSSIFMVLVVVLLLAIFLYIPSLNEIQQRRADKKALEQYALQIKVDDGETLVRIMRKNCYSFQPKSVKAEDKVYDWCQIDPKKY